MASDQFLVSVVVPTHNRSQYAISCVQSLLDIESGGLQIVVHDTSDDSCRLRTWAVRQDDPRLLYRHWPRRLSMTENHEQAISLASGEYVCLIGDDDSVSANLLTFAEMACNRGDDILTPTVSAAYYWPDFRTRFYGAAHAGRIYVTPFTGKLDERDAKESLMDALEAGCQGTDLMPKLYHGLVRRTVLQGLQRSHGSLFFGTSPDMSAAVLLGLRGGTYRVIDLPLTLPGSAGGSNSGRSAMRRHKGDLAQDPHTAPFVALEWPDVIPRFFSVETVWAQAAWMTLSKAKNNECLERFNLARLYALCRLNHREYARAIRAAQHAANTAGFPRADRVAVRSETFRALMEKANRLSVRLLNPSPGGRRRILAVVEDVRAARQSLDATLTNSGALSALPGQSV